jgi:molybdate transport system ATP-binding protein
VIEIDLELPLAHFTLAVRCSLGENVTALVGPSGSGKTSLIESIAGLRGGARGHVVIDGEDVVALPPERRRIGYVPQDVALFPHLNVRHNLTFGGSARFDDVVTILELAPLLDRAPASLSGGERQRVALGRALMTTPRLLLLDEPLAAIDQPLRERVLVFLRRVRDLGVPMLYVTHQPFEAMALANWCVVLERGRVVDQGPPREMLAASGGEVDNVFEVTNPRHEPERGITSVTTADGRELVLPYDAVASAAFPLIVRISADEIVVFGEKPSSVSSRNLIEATIERMTERDGVVDLTAGQIRVRVTRAAADDLGLREGGRVWLALRSRAFRIVG